MNYRRALAPYPPIQPEVGLPGRPAQPNPAQIRQALRRGDWETAVRLAMGAGVTDVNQLTDSLFYVLHPELRGKRISSSQRDLGREWIDIRDRRVRPVLESRGRSPAGTPAGKPTQPGEAWQSQFAAPMQGLAGTAPRMRLLRLEDEFEEHEDIAVAPLGYDEILNRIRQELVLPFSDPNDPGLALRRRRLRGAFASVPAARTRELYARLGEQPTRDELSRLFHGRLATATRRELLKILHDRFPPDVPATVPKPPAAPAPVWPSEPLPPADKARFQVALDALNQKVAGTTDPRAWRYRCWLAKLAAGADDRVIEWHRICPRTSGAIGAAYVIGPCDITAGNSVDQAELEAAIKTVPDVESANQRLKFITHMRSDILFTYELTSPDLHLENFMRFHDEVNAAVTKLDQWANSPMGGSSAMPSAYISIKDWIGARQRDPNSVYSCL